MIGKSSSSYRNLKGYLGGWGAAVHDKHQWDHLCGLMGSQTVYSMLKVLSCAVTKKTCSLPYVSERWGHMVVLEHTSF